MIWFFTSIKEFCVFKEEATVKEERLSTELSIVSDALSYLYFYLMNTLF